MESEVLGRTASVLHTTMLRISSLLKDYCLSGKVLVNVLLVQTINRNSCLLLPLFSAAIPTCNY